MDSDIPRRIQLQLMTRPELAIRDAIAAVEEAGCDVLLTEAVVLLGQAKEKVSDYVDRKLKAIRRARTEALSVGGFYAEKAEGCHRRVV